MEHAARARRQAARVAVVVGPLEVEVVAQQRQQHAHAARVQGRQQRQRVRLAADADERGDRAGPERAGVRRERGAEALALLRAAQPRGARAACCAAPPSARPAARAQRSSRTYGTPSAAGAPSRRLTAPVETATSTTIVITYGSAWKSSGATVDAARLQRERQAENAPNRYAPTRQRPGRQNAKMTSAIAIQPAPPREPVDPLRRDREAEAGAADAGERAAGERVRVAVARDVDAHRVGGARRLADRAHVRGPAACARGRGATATASTHEP